MNNDKDKIINHQISYFSITDNFFDMGGNSLLAIKLANFISSEFNIELKALIIFEHPTIKSQSEYVSGNKEEKSQLQNSKIDDRMSSRKNINFRKLRG